MKIVPTYISSSNVEAVGYKGGDLFIRFVKGQVYRYSKVPYDILKGLVEAESAGQFFHRNIRPVFETVKLESDPFSDAARR